jgi:FkbM family methyltransferase
MTLLSYPLHYAVLLATSCIRPVQADCELEVLRRIKENYPDWLPESFIDIGANVGCWTARAKEMYPDASFLMFEAFEDFRAPLQEKKEKLGSDQVDFNIAVLSAQDGQEVDFFANGDTGNSMFLQQTSVYTNTKPMKRITARADTLKRESFLKDKRVDYVKLDVQGAELVVLEGATEILKEATFVQFEGSLVEYNKGAACFYEIDDFLRRHEFLLYDFGDQLFAWRLFKTHGTGQFDAVYIKPTSEFLPPALKQGKPNFCGSDRPHFSAALESSSQNTPDTTNMFAPPTRSNPELVFLGIILGFVVGVFWKGQKISRRRK